MILSAQSIRSALIIQPFHERTKAFGLSFGLSAAGYDIRVAQDLTIEPRGFTLASSVERFEMPDDVLGRVADKSTWARRGLAVQNTIIEPGWMGYLTLELTNHGSQAIRILCGSPIAQIIFERLDFPTTQPYLGRYQNQGPDPQPAVEIAESAREGEF